MLECSGAGIKYYVRHSVDWLMITLTSRVIVLVHFKVFHSSKDSIDLQAWLPNHNWGRSPTDGCIVGTYNTRRVFWSGDAGSTFLSNPDPFSQARSLRASLQCALPYR